LFRIALSCIIRADLEVPSSLGNRWVTRLRIIRIAELAMRSSNKASNNEREARGEN
jgi:hypothetical protein